MITVIILYSLPSLYAAEAGATPEDHPYRKTVCGSLHCLLCIAEQLALSTIRGLSKRIFSGV